MSKILHELEELVARQVITPEVASSIREYYSRDKGQGTSRMLIAFGIFGSLLVGLGIILIIAHNWDNFPKAVKIALGLLPLLVCQLLAFQLIRKDSQSVAWREGTAVALICAVAASISIVSQVYHISGDLSRFLFVWTALSIPVCYLLRSSAASLIAMVGLTWYGVESGYYPRHNDIPWFYWGGMLALLPWYVQLIRHKPTSNQTDFHHWFVVISLLINVTTISVDPGILLVFVFGSLFSIFMLIGQLNVFSHLKIIANAWLVAGSLGWVAMLLFFTFEDIWEDVNELSGITAESDLFFWMATFIIAAALLYLVGSRIGYRQVLSKSYLFLVLPVFVITAQYAVYSTQLLANLLTLAVGILTVREGAKGSKLWQMNYGLLIIAALILCRFFDTDLSFVVRGILFVMVGASFFAMNYWVVRQRQNKPAA